MATPLYASQSSSLFVRTEPPLTRWTPPARPKRRGFASSTHTKTRSPLLTPSLFPPPRRRHRPENSQFLNAVDSNAFSGGSSGGGEGDSTKPEPENDGAIEVEDGVVDVGGNSNSGGGSAGAPSGSSSTPTAAPAPSASTIITPLLPVPWGLSTVFGVMLLWLLAFWSLGYLIVPGILEFAGMAPRDALPPKSAAVVHLFLEAAELAATALVLWRVLRKYRPRPLGWFRADLGRPIKRWALPLLLVVAAFPLVDRAAAAAAFCLPDALWFFFRVPFPTAPVPLPQGPSSLPAVGGASAMEAAIAAGDKATCALYLAVVAIAAPLWEEAIFRGFLLASLTKHVPHRWAIACSSLVFAMAHFAPHRVAPLLLLGLLFGWLYSRTRSLGAAVLAHSLWNVYIFAGLLLGRGAAGVVV